MEMFARFGAEYDSSSRCSSSPAAESLTRYSSPGSMGSPAQPQDIPVMRTTNASFAPMANISTSPSLQWMSQPSSLMSSSAAQASDRWYDRMEIVKMPGFRGHTSSNRRAKVEQISSEEDEKRRLRRERNKMAAAKCRNRRKEITDTLQAETDSLEDEKSALQTEIDKLLKEKERLEFILMAHEPVCKVPSEKDTHSMAEMTSKPSSSSFPDLDASLEESLDLLESLESGSVETSRSVPDVDLYGSFYLQDWEPLYSQAAGDTEPLCTPLVTCTPSFTSFSYANSLPSSQQRVSGSSSDSLDSPTLLTL